MKIFKLSHGFTNIKAAYKEAKIAKNFSMEGYGEACNEIYKMREAIANFAKRNNVRVDILELPDKKGSVALETFVRGLKKNEGHSILKIFDGDINKIYPKISERTIIIPIKGEETQVARSVVSTTEDTFLRHFFRNIEEMTKQVNNPPKLP